MSLRLAIRGLRRTPGLTATIILTLAVGIGLATAVFTVANALLIRPLPVRDEDRLVVLWGETPDGRFRNIPLSVNETREFARRSNAVEHVASFGYFGSAPNPLRIGDRTSLVHRALVSGNFFDVLGANALLGRTLRPDDDLRGAHAAIVLSHAGWQRHFAGDSAAVGRQIVMHEIGLAYTIVGVMPRGLDFPRGTELWAPVIPVTTRSGAVSAAEVDVLARLRPGASPEDARRELTEFLQRDGAGNLRRGARGVVHTLPEIVLGDTKPALVVIAAAVVLLLVITCVNIATLLLVRGLARVGEIALRAALGATRRTLIAQFLTESALLAIAGGVLGTLLAVIAVRAFTAFAPPGLPRLDEIQISEAFLAGAVAITGVALLLFAVAPALLSSRVDLESVLRATTRQSGGSGRFRRASEALVVGQVAVALLMLSAAALITRSFVELRRVDLAVEPANVLIATLALDQTRLDTVARQLAALEQVVTRLEATPGIRAASPVVAVPFSAVAWDARPTAEGQTAEQMASNPMLNMELVSPSYFEAMGMPVLRGRGFALSDRMGSLPVVIISEGAARHYWPGGDPVGKRFTMGRSASLTVIGIVPDTRYRNLRDARPSIYFPLGQSAFPFAPTALAIRTEGQPGALIPVVRDVVGATDPAVSVSSAVPFETFLDREHAQIRLQALLLVVFAGAGVALAAIGLFGVMASMVRQRSRELGIRMAMGATAADVRRMVLRRGLSLAAGGTAIGIVGALIANRVLAALLFQVSPTDAVTLGAVAGLLLGVAWVASAIPARASTRIDPAVTLRAEV